MPQPSAFEPIWPPVSADAFEDWPEVREARKMYEGQKLALHGLATEGLGELSGTDAHRLAQEIAVLLHNISGTAAHFGEAPVGRRASELEQTVRTAFTQQLLHPRCKDILAAIDPDSGA